MQVRGVKSGVVCASNGGCDAFDINRSLAEGVMELAHDFSNSSPASLALGIITLQKAARSISKKTHAYTNGADFLSDQGI